MNKKILILAGVSAVLYSFSAANAGTGPTFTILLPSGVSSNISVDKNSTATITYTVMNTTKTPRMLTMTGITAVSQIPGAGNCNFPAWIEAGQSCNLALLITGSQVPSIGVAGGPKICKTIGPNNNNPDFNLCSTAISPLNITSTADGRTVAQSVSYVNSLVAEMKFPCKPTLPTGGIPWRVKPFISSIWGLLANGFNIPDTANLYSSTCGAGNSFCVFGGDIPRSDNPAVRKPLIMQSTNGGLTWTTVNIPSFAPAAGKFSAVSCGSDLNGVSTCAAIGMDTSTNIPFLVETTDGGQTWSQINAATFTSSVTLNAVDCTVNSSKYLCQTSGNDGTGPVVYYDYTGAGTGGIWQSQMINGSNISTVSATNAISCVSMASTDINCLVVLDNNFPNEPTLVKTQLGAVNYSVNAINNLSLQGANVGINAVGCTLTAADTAFCTAAGSKGGVPFLVQNNDLNIDSNWSTVPVNQAQGQFSGVSCASLNGDVLCNAAGNVVNKPYLVATKDSGTAWASPSLPTMEVGGKYTSASSTVSGGKVVGFITGELSGSKTPVIVESNDSYVKWAPSETFVSLFELAQ